MQNIYGKSKYFKINDEKKFNEFLIKYNFFKLLPPVPILSYKKLENTYAIECDSKVNFDKELVSDIQEILKNNSEYFVYRESVCDIENNIIIANEGFITVITKTNMEQINLQKIIFKNKAVC